MLQSWNCQPAACLHFQLFVYIFISCLFTFLSADCLQFEFSRQNLGFPSVFCQNNASKLELSVSCLFTFSAVCLQFEFSRQKPCFPMTFLPLQMLQHFNC